MLRPGHANTSERSEIFCAVLFVWCPMARKTSQRHIYSECQMRRTSKSGCLQATRGMQLFILITKLMHNPPQLDKKYRIFRKAQTVVDLVGCSLRLRTFGAADKLRGLHLAPGLRFVSSKTAVPSMTQNLDCCEPHSTWGHSRWP